MGIEGQIFSLAVLLVLSGFFSGSEVALISLTDSKVKHMLSKKKPGVKYVKKLKDNPQKMLSAILIGNNVANIGAAALMTAIMIDIFADYAVGIATGVMTLLILIFGEITPKAIAAQNSEKISRLVAPPIWVLSVVISPILNILDWFLNRLLKLIGVKPKQISITEEEIRHIVETAEEEGSIKGIEKKLIDNIFEIDETMVGEITTPITDMVSINFNANVGEAISLVAKKKHSRIPVHKKGKHKIVGIIYLRDLIGMKKSEPISKIMKNPYMVPSTKKVGDLLTRFQKRKEHLAIVVDEHGAVKGLVTLEDCIEEIVGEIVDESEKIHMNVKKIGSNTWMVQGKIEIEEVNEKLKMKIPEGKYNTLSGFILENLGRIPSLGDVVNHGLFKLHVEEKDNHRISKVRIEKGK